MKIQCLHNFKSGSFINPSTEVCTKLCIVIRWLIRSVVCLFRSFISIVHLALLFFQLQRLTVFFVRSNHSFHSSLSFVHSSNCWLNIKLNEFIKFTGLSFSIFLIFYKEILNKTFRLRLFVLRQPFYAVIRANTNIKCESFHRITSMKT